jgi:purine-nucleoside phosphorylase
LNEKSKDIELQINESIRFLKNKEIGHPDIAIILGSGLGNFADSLTEKIKIPTSQVPHYPRSTVVGHAGNLVSGRLENIKVLAVQGRTHFYEGHSIDDTVYIVRLLAKLGVNKLIVTNAAGGVNRIFKPGDLMIITDHINFMFRNPLRGPVVTGEQRWPDLLNAYDPEYVVILEQIGLELKIPLRKGVLMASTGPTYESAAEIRMARTLGADAVSMSTVPEVLTARALSMKVAGISCITNLATGISPNPLSHNEVTEIAEKVNEKFQRLVREALKRLGVS